MDDSTRDTISSDSASRRSDYDVVVVGGGASGLAAAIALGRSRRSVLVVDAGQQRNLPSDAAHNVLGREGVGPVDLVAAGEREAAEYGVEIAHAVVTAARRDGEHFSVDYRVGEGETATSHSIGARRIILATGLVDDLPDIEGLSAAWGATVLHCPYCHGWEVRDRSIGVIGTNSDVAVHQALLLRQLSDDVTVFLHDTELDDEQRADLTAMQITIVDGPVQRVRVDGRDVRAVVVDGVDHAIQAVAVGPVLRVRSELYESLGGTLEDAPNGQVIPSEPEGRTPIDGVWAVGNVSDTRLMVAAAAAGGVGAGTSVNADLVAEDVRKARAAG